MMPMQNHISQTRLTKSLFIMMTIIFLALPNVAAAENKAKVEGKYKELQVQLEQAEKQVKELKTLSEIVIDRYDRILLLLKDNKNRWRSGKSSAKDTIIGIKEAHKRIKRSYKDIKGPYDRFTKESLEARKAAEALIKEMKKK